MSERAWLRWKRGPNSRYFIVHERWLHVYFWRTGIGASIWWRGEWLRPTVQWNHEIDDGAIRIHTDTALWRGDNPRKRYRVGSKRYLRVRVAVRWRGRRDYTTKPPRNPNAFFGPGPATPARSEVENLR